MIHLLVDYENVHYTGLTGTEYLTSEDHLIVFYSNPCMYIPNYRVRHILDSGCSFEICKLKNQRKNALDFYIATKVGEILAEDKDSNVAIVSCDHGFQSVKDYWNCRINPTNRLVTNGTIASCIISSAEPNCRKTWIKDDMKIIGLEDAYNKCREHENSNRIKEDLMKVFADTEYADLVPQIISIVTGDNDLKTMYIDSLKSFGKEKGLNVYRQLRRVV